MNAPEPLYPKQPPLRIALLGYRSHPHVGGQGIYLKFLSQALVDLGHSVDVISGPPYPELSPQVGLIKLPSLDLYASEKPHKELRLKHFLSVTDLYEFGSKMTGGFAEPYTFSRRAARYLAKHRQRYDIVHDNQCLGYGLLTLQKMGIPTVATIHHPITRDRALAEAAQPTELLKKLTRRWYRFVGMQIKVAQQLNHLTTVSEFTRQDIAQAFAIAPEKLHVIANGVNTDLFRPLAEANKQPLHLVTTASSDQPLKGQRFLLQALTQLRASIPGVSLTIIGALKAESECEQIIKQHNLGPHIIFKQSLSNQELVAEYNRATVAVTPSLYEGFGLPAAEAMACGTAVVTSDGGALPEVVGDAGIVVPAGDSKALAEAIGRVLTNPALAAQLAAQGRARVATQLCWSNTATALTEFYHRILNPTEVAQPCTPSTTSA
ncbi:glycosyltransferase family 4 protein [Halioxenophilus aromaticivorans]